MLAPELEHDVVEPSDLAGLTSQFAGSFGLAGA